MMTRFLTREKPRDKSHHEEKPAGMRLSVTVTGMTCQKGCANKIQRCLNELPGVSSATVDFPARTASVVTDGLTAADLISCVQTSGPAGKFDATELASGGLASALF